MAMFTLMRKNEEVMILQMGEDGNTEEKTFKVRMLVS